MNKKIKNNIYSSKKTALKIINIIIFNAVFLPWPGSLLFSQEQRQIELTAQEILARVDRILGYPRGQLKGKMTHITPDGNSKIINFVGSISEEDFLFSFFTNSRGDELKVLYNMGGEDIWVYNIHAIKLFNKRGIDKYDPILATNYYYIDISNANLQSNYDAVINGDAFIKGMDSFKLDLLPIDPASNYGLLTLYVEKKDFIPLRIDYHDTDKVIFKTLSIVKIGDRNNRIFPLRYDMLNIRNGTVTLLEFFELDETIKFDKKIFRHQDLGVDK